MAGELIVDVEKRFPGGAAVEAAFRHPSDPAAVTVLFGPSGAGKTTILRCIAGLERPERGTIRFGDEVWLDAERGTFVPPQQRSVGYLFQDYALFPHLTVRRNIAYGLGRLPGPERDARVEEILALFGLEGLEGRHPRSLSGGEQQRVALARAIVCRPRLLLLDEPLSALDAPTRDAVRRTMRRLLRLAGVPAVLVTHDRLEALALGDQLVVVEGGRTRQSGPVPEVFSRPADPAVARIVGVETIAPGTVVEQSEGLATVAVGDARLTAVVSEPVRDEVFVCVRSEDVILERGAAHETSARNRLRALVTEVDCEGPLVWVTLDCGFVIRAVVTRQSCETLGVVEGAEVMAVIKAPSVHLVPRE